MCVCVCAFHFNWKPVEITCGHLRLQPRTSFATKSNDLAHKDNIDEPKRKTVMPNLLFIITLVT